MVAKNGGIAVAYRAAGLAGAAVVLWAIVLAVNWSCAQVVRDAYYITLPGSSLSLETVQEEIGLSADQVKKITKISREYSEFIRQQYSHWPKPSKELQKMSAEERKKKDADFDAENLNRKEEARKQIDALLTPEQRKTLAYIELRGRAWYGLMYAPSDVLNLNLTEKQKAEWKKMSEEMRQKETEIPKQVAAAALKLLTPEQLEKLEPRPPTWGAGMIEYVQVQVEIGLSADQVKKITEVNRQLGFDFGKVVNERRKMSAEEQEKKRADFAAENLKHNEEVRKQIDALLTPEQRKTLAYIELRQQAWRCLAYGADINLNLTEKQKAEWDKIRKEIPQRTTEIQKQASAAALKLLTQEQIEKLKTRQRAWGGVGIAPAKPGPLDKPAPGSAAPKK